MDQDQEHLRLLSIFHYVVGGLVALFACFPILHLVVGIAMVTGAFDKPDHPGPPWFVGLLFIGIAGVIILMGWTLAACVVLAGRLLGKHRAYTYCLVIAAIECLFIPFGTVLGVFTIIVLVRPSVKAIFDAESGLQV